MPASLYPPACSLSLTSLDLMESNCDNRTEQLALQLALLQGNYDPATSLHPPQHHHHHHMAGHQTPNYGGNNDLGSGGGSLLLNGSAVGGGSLEDLKTRRSQNMTECVPVPSSEHVAEIVGRQGCKIKALRAKTNTYIKTPVRGEEPVFVVTGRKEDVAAAKREILSAADHFSQIRASRKNNINSTLAIGQLMANTPGQTTVQVRVPYRVVGLVVGPKGATIKRIQQQTHTYIVTPSRDKEPVFEVTGLPENVDAARKEIEAHIALRTGQTSGSGGPLDGSFFGDEDNLYRMGGGNSSSGFSSSSLDHLSNNGNDKFSSILNGLDSPYSSLTANNHPPQHRNGGGVNGVPAGITLRNLLESNNYDLGINSGRPSGSMVPWSNGDSHDSGIGNSPPFDSLTGGVGNGLSGGSALHDNHAHHHMSSLNGIWGDLSRALGGLDLSSNNLVAEKPFLSVGSRSSLDLGTLGRPLIGGWGGTGTPTTSSNAPSASMMTTANNHHNSLGGPNSNGHYMNGGGALDSLPSSRSSITTEPSPPNSLPFTLQDPQGLDQMVCHALDNGDSSYEPDNTSMIPDHVAFSTDSLDEKSQAPLSCAGDFLTFAN